jgi:hypothetical protein
MPAGRGRRRALARHRGRRPAFSGPRDEGIREILVNRGGAFHGFRQETPPLDVVRGRRGPALRAAHPRLPAEGELGAPAPHLARHFRGARPARLQPRAAAPRPPSRCGSLALRARRRRRGRGAPPPARRALRATAAAAGVEDSGHDPGFAGPGAPHPGRGRASETRTGIGPGSRAGSGTVPMTMPPASGNVAPSHPRGRPNRCAG